jgi:hypothetical protein
LEGNMRERRRRGKEILEVDEPHPTRRHKCHSGVWNRTGRENVGQEKGPRNTFALPKKCIKYHYTPSIVSWGPRPS